MRVAGKSVVITGGTGFLGTHVATQLEGAGARVFPVGRRDEILRAVVEEHRIRSHDPRSLSGLVAEVGHLRTAVDAIAEKVRRHEEQLRNLQRLRKAN